MSDDRLTPEERAMIEAAVKWVDVPCRRTDDQLADAVDAYRKATAPPEPMEQMWTRKRQSTRHRCEDLLPPSPQGDEGDRWRCPTCGRRWNLTFKNTDVMSFGAEPFDGVSIEGPDGSVYWRGTRTRFIGAVRV